MTLTDLNFGQLWEYPFRTDVWGNVSDWVMITVTALTALFLWRTLRSQIDIQTLQTKLFDIEKERFRSEILPVFSICIDNEQLEFEGDEIVFDIGFLSIVLNQHWAYKVAIKLSDGSGSKSSDHRWALSEADMFFQKQEPFTATIITGEFNGKRHSEQYYFSLDLNIRYEDRDKNIYEQQAHIYLSSSMEGIPRIQITRPELIKSL